MRRSGCDFILMVDSDKAIDSEAQRDYELWRGNKKIRTATEVDLLCLMTEGKWDLIFEFKYRRPELKKRVDELEFQYLDDHDQRMSQWKRCNWLINR
jgi:hypothetical protein